MKFFIMSGDGRGHNDNILLSGIVRNMEIVDRYESADAVIVPVSYYNDYVFNKDLYRIKLPWIAFDSMEYGWDWDRAESHLFGVNSGAFSKVSGPEYMKLDEFFRDVPPVLYFKRELLASDVSERVMPIEYVTWWPEPDRCGKAEFHSRRITVFYNWGYSHPSRMLLHGEIFSKMHNYEIISEWGHYEKYFSSPRGETWAPIFTPHFARVNYNEIIRFQNDSKISVSLPGCGVKCFRHGEANVGSIMAMQYDNLAWSVPFDHGVNCLRIRSENMFQDLYESAHRDDLYDIYVRSYDTSKKYRAEYYAKNYIIPNIERVL